MVFTATTNNIGENGDKKQNTLPYTLQFRRKEVCLVGAKRTFLYIFTLTRVAPLAARPGGQLSIVQVARQVYYIPSAQGNPFARANASTLDSRHNHFISQKQKRTAMGAFSFLEQFLFYYPNFCTRQSTLSSCYPYS